MSFCGVRLSKAPFLLQHFDALVRIIYARTRHLHQHVYILPRFTLNYINLNQVGAEGDLVPHWRSNRKPHQRGENNHGGDAMRAES